MRALDRLRSIASSTAGRAVLLAALVVVPFLPSVPGGWLWDDDLLLVDNPQVTRVEGLVDVWFRNTSLDYFPLTTTSFWLEYRLWGDWPPGYRAVNLGLHAINAVLVWRVLLGLGVPGAWAAALLWGVHPITVSSAAWIAERKNTLSLLFACLSVLAWLRHEREGGRRAYAAALGWFVASLLAKTSLVSLPLVFPLLVWWREGRIERRDLAKTIPFLAASLVLGLVTLWYQAGHAKGPSPGIVAIAREMLPRGAVLSGKAVGFYLWKDVWPTRLAMVHPWWNLDTAAPASYLASLSLLAVLAGLWCARARRWARACFVALAAFVLLLAPVLGFLPATFMRNLSFVADQWQYVALVVPVALFVSGVWRLVPSEVGRAVVVAVVGVASAVATARHAAIYADDVKVWRHNVAISDSWAGHTGLARALMAADRPAEAIVEARKAVAEHRAADPAWMVIAEVSKRLGRTHDAAEASLVLWNNTQNHAFLHDAAIVLAKAGELEGARAIFATAVEKQPRDAALRIDHGSCLSRLGRHEEAERSYREAVALEADNPVALNALAFHLASRPGSDAAEAVELAGRACRATGDADPSMLDTLATAHAAAGDFGSALRVGEDAVARARAAGDEALAAEILARVELFRAGKPFVAP